MQSKIRGASMKDIFNQFSITGCAVIKVAQPINKKTPKAIQDLGFVHYEKDKNKTYDAAIKEFKEMSPESYEYSRLGIYHAIEHIMDDLFDLKIDFGQLVSFKTSSDIFVGLFDNMQNYFKDFKEMKSKKINQKIIKYEVEAITSYVEGVLFLKKVAEKDNQMIPLIAQYEDYQKELFAMLESHQQTIQISKPNYKKIEVSDIVQKAQAAMDLSMKFNYSSINYDEMERIMIMVGNRKDYWYAMQNEGKWAKLYEDKNRQSLSEDDLQQLRSQLPLIFEQYKTLHYLSFTNMFKALLVAASYYGSKMASHNEREPKNDDDFNKRQKIRDEEIERDKTEFLHKPISKKVQKPEITLENLNFASDILSAAMTVTTLIDNVCGLTDSSKDFLVLENFNTDYDIVKLTNSDLAILLTKDQEHLHGDLVDVVDLGNIKIPSCIKKQSKGTSFTGMSHFLKEIKQPFVQEYFFGKQDSILNFVDNR